jgi:hypothetical protein
MYQSKEIDPRRAKAAEFNQRPEYLLLAIVYNNPEQVSQNLQSYAGVSYAQTAEQIMDWFEQYGGQLDEKTLYDILNVPFNPDVDNITADYQDVLEYAINQGGGNGEELAEYTWAGIFPDAIKKMYDKYFAGQQSTGTIGEDLDLANSQKQMQGESQQQKADKARKRWKIALMVLNGIVVLSFLAFMVFAIMSMAKKTKIPTPSAG